MVYGMEDQEFCGVGETPTSKRRHLHIRPLTLKSANEYVGAFHRHHKPVQGHRFSLACYDNTTLVGIVICGRPVARGCNPDTVLEVSRLCSDGSKDVCSKLYAVCARIAQEMGFEKIQTYILETEPGTSLKAAGWIYEATTAGGDWNHSKKYAGKRRQDQPMCPKHRWAREFHQSR